MKKLYCLIAGLLCFASVFARNADYRLEADCGSGFVPVTVHKALCSDSASHHGEIWNDWDNSKGLRDTMSIALLQTPHFPVRIRLSREEAFSTVAVRPTPYGIEARKLNDHCVEFIIDSPAHRKVSVEFDDDRATNLFLVCNLPDTDKPSPDDPSVLYFGPGEHNVGKICLQEGQTLYVDYGAVLYSAIEVQGNNCRIAGQGIISGARLPHTGTRWASGELLIECNKTRAAGRRNLVIEDVTIIDSPSWTVSVYNMSDVRIENINLINWILNGDGIDVVCSRDVLIKDCLLRCYDDCITLKVRHNARPIEDLRNVRIEGCMIWADFARGIVIGPEAGNESVSPAHISDCQVKSCIFLEHNTIVQKDDVRGAFAIHQVASPDWEKGCPGLISSITAEDLFFDHMRPCSRAIVIAQDEHSSPACRMEDIIIRNVRIEDDGTAPSVLEIKPYHNSMKNLKLENISRNGRRIVTPAIREDAQMESRIDSILNRLTLEEKIGQMTQLTVGVLMDREREHLIPELMDTVFRKYKVGSILNVIGNSAPPKEKYISVIREIQRKSIEEIGIPCLYGLDQIHGASYIDGATLFPQEINIAASFERGFALDMGRICAYETRAALVPWTFAPVMDLGREPLWPRMWESFGEDSYLNAELGKAALLGLQGDNPGKVDSLHIAACIKHYMAYGVPVSGQDRTPSKVSDAELREKYFEPFKQCIREGALSLMVNSSSNNGIPFHANRELLTVWLKENLNWDGMIVTDWNDINNLYYRDRVATSEKDAVRLAINAGIDMAMVPSTWKFCIDLKELVEEGAVPIERIDDAVRRVLRLKMRLGLFEQPVWDTGAYADFASPEFEASSYRAAVESEVLLKNDGVLPLREGQKILVCGPNANSMRCINGGWSYTWQGDGASRQSAPYHTILEALQSRFPGKVSYCPGVEYAPENGDNWYEEKPADFKALRKAASRCDVIVACIGEQSYCETPGNWKDLNLSAQQQEMLKVLAQSGKPIVIAYSGGRPRVVRELEPLASAFVAMMLPGNYGADAFAALVSGDENFSAKLPFTWPKYTAGYAPYDYKVSENVATMEGEYNYDARMDAQWQFGDGLSYTSFEYSDLRCSQSSFGPDDLLEFRVRVTNSGSVDGREAVLLFSSDMYASEVPDVRRLRAFDKISLKAGESKEVILKVKASDLAFVGSDGRWRLEKGDFRISCGSQNIVVTCTSDRIWDDPDLL